VVVHEGDVACGAPRAHHQAGEDERRRAESLHRHHHQDGAQHVELRVVRQIPTPQHALQNFIKHEICKQNYHKKLSKS